MTLTELEKLAKAALALNREYYHDIKVLDVEELDDFMEAANPTTVLALIEQIREMREALKQLKLTIESDECRGDEDCDHCSRIQDLIDPVLAKYPEDGTIG